MFRLMVGLLLLKIGEHIGKILFALGLMVMCIFLGIIVLTGISKLALLWVTVGVFIACIGSRLMN